MNKEIIIECKYKFYDKEKFNGQTYCTLHNEICKDLSFACDTNCQIYEDYKQLKRKEQECERLKDKLNCCFCNPYVELNDLKKQRKCVEETECFRRQLDKLKAENEELKRQIKVKGNILKLTNEAKNEYLDENNKLKQLLQSYISDYKKMYEANTTF